MRKKGDGEWKQNSKDSLDDLKKIAKVGMEVQLMMLKEKQGVEDDKADAEMKATLQSLLKQAGEILAADTGASSASGGLTHQKVMELKASGSMGILKIEDVKVVSSKVTLDD